jgi:succinate-acetate transporter protein
MYSSDSDFEKPSPPSRLEICGDGNECVIIAGHKYYRHELYRALSGSFQAEHLAVPPVHKFGNPTAFSLGSYFVTTLTAGLFLVNAGNVEIPNVVYAGCMFCNGVYLFLGGLWEFFLGNTFGCTSLISYGAYWLAFGATYLPAFGIIDAYKDDPDQFDNAMGFWFLAWAIYTTMLWTCTFKSTVDLCAFFGFLNLSIIFSAASHFMHSHTLQVVAGVFCIFTALSAFYMMLSCAATSTNTYLRFPAVDIPIWGNN